MKTVNLLIVALALLLLSGCVVNRTKTAQRTRAGEEVEAYLFENQSVLDSFMSHLKGKKIPGRYCAEAYVLFAGFVSEMTAPSKFAWINDYQRKVDINGDKLITKDELEFVISFEAENE